MSHSVEKPETTKGAPALVSADEFRYRFPPSPRRLGGQFSVEESSRRLLRLAACHRTLMRALAGWIIGIPEFEVKVEVAHHLYMHAEAARNIRQRLAELRVTHATFDAHADEEVALVVAEVACARNAPELLVATHCVMAKRMLDAVRLHAGLTDGLADLPSVRLLRHVDLDLAEMVEWGEAAVRSYVAGGEDAALLEEWRAHLEAVLAHVGGVTGDGERGPKPRLRHESGRRFSRRVGCARDERFNLFHHTRDYRKADHLGAAGRDEYERTRLELIRVQRDEIDAIETFANVLHDLDSASFDFQMDLARFVWDEARHAEIGHQSLAALGFDPYEVPCGVIGINVRSPLAPELAFAQISIFGELNIVGPMRRLSQTAYQRGDQRTAITFDFIHADELIHLRRGRAWLKELAPDGDLLALQKEARAVALKRLVEEEVIGEDYAMNLTDAEIGQLIGE
jgi:hypothetical protein